MSDTTHIRRRLVQTVGVLAALAVVVVGVAAYASIGPDDAEETATAIVLASVTVEQSDLTTTEQLSGTIELVDDLPVVHRTADGATSTNGGGSTTVGATPDGMTTAASTPQASDGDTTIASASVLQASYSNAAQATSTTAAATTPTTMTIPVTTIEPTTTVPSTTVPSTTVPSTTVPSTTVPSTTVPSTTESPVTTTSEPEPTTGACDEAAPPPSTSTTVASPPTSIADGSTTSTTTTTSIPCPDTTTTTTTPRFQGGPGGEARGGAGLSGGAGGAPADTTVEPTFVVTSLAAVGSTIDLGDVVYSTDGVPVVAMGGSVPAWRTLSTGSEDGIDVRQLEQSLVSLGYHAHGELEVDETFTSATAEAVGEWQEGLGLEATGEVELGSIVFLSEAAEVISHSITVGAAISEGDTVLTLAAPAVQIIADVPESLQSVLAPGDIVAIDGGDATGVVSLLRAATDAATGEVIIQAVVIPDQALPDDVPGDTSNVMVTIEGAAAVLTVPSEAVASRLDGSYAVQLVGADGTAEWITVDIEGTVGQRTAVRGPGIEAGAMVLEPA